MAFYPPDVIQRARQMDLLTYLKNYEPEELVHFSRDTYMTRTHDSLKISNGKWYWFSRGFGGRSALDYLVKVREYTFMQAVETIVGSVRSAPPKIYESTKKTMPDRLILPNKAPNNEKAKSYLMNRGIDESIIQQCIDNDLIYQQFQNNNVVFVGYDKNKKARYAMCRGTNESRYMQEATGSHKAFSFRLKSNQFNDNIHIFESYIDLLSYATLLKINNVTTETLNINAYNVTYKNYDLTIYYEKTLTEEDKLALEKEITDLETSIAKRKSLLANANFVSKAPANLVESEKEKLALEEEKLEKLKG